MTTIEHTYTAQRAGKCRICGVWIHANEPCAISPFRHPECSAWKPGELEALAVSIGKAPPVVPSFVTAIDRKECDKKLAELSAELLRADKKCDGIVRFNPDHFGMTHWQCVERREQIEGEIVYWRTQADAVPA